MFNRVFVVINPASGKPEPILNTLYQAFKETPIRWDVGVLQDDNLDELLKRAEGFGADIVAAYGGDGTQASVAGRLRGSGLPMAILPGGTANVMALELDIPTDLKEACGLLTAEAPLLHWRGKRATIKAEGAVPLEYDGEILEADRYEVEVLEQAVRVLEGPKGEKTPK